MRFGAHLPIAGFSLRLPKPGAIAEFAEAAEALGFTTICANDHLLFSVPWVDGLTALAVAAGRTSHVRLMTTAALLAVRGAAPLRSALAALQYNPVDTTAPLHREGIQRRSAETAAESAIQRC